MAFVYAEQASWNSRKLFALVVAIAINVGFLAAIRAGLVFEPLTDPGPGILVDVPPDIALEPEPIPAPPPYQPDFIAPADPPPLYLPPMEVERPVIEDAPPIYAGEQPESAPQLPAPAIRELQVNKALTPPEYPVTAIRRGEQGTVRL